MIHITEPDAMGLNEIKKPEKLQQDEKMYSLLKNQGKASIMHITGPDVMATHKSLLEAKINT
jgi:hypothetical protein